MRRYLLAPACALAVGALVWPRAAAPQNVPWAGGPAPANNPGAAPARAPATPVIFPVTPEAGEWMVCAASYMGPDAIELSRQLVLELRNRQHLPAYIFNHADEERRKQADELERVRRLNPDLRIPRRTVRIQEQCAVLVGGYKDFASASEGIKAIKDLPMPKLSLGEGKLAFDTVSVYEPDPEKRVMRVKRAPLSPYLNALVVRNPTLPPPARPAAAADPFWKELNADEDYSLLKCPARFTLVIKEYTGGGVMQQSRSTTSGFLNLLGMGRNKPGEALSAAGAQAHALADMLHKQLGFQAYVLHTRTKSIVTVGGFGSLDDPDMLRVKRQLASLKFRAQKNPNAPDPIGLFVQPLPMEIPHF